MIRRVARPPVYVVSHYWKENQTSLTIILLGDVLMSKRPGGEEEEFTPGGKFCLVGGCGGVWYFCGLGYFLLTVFIYVKRQLMDL